MHMVSPKNKRRKVAIGKIIDIRVWINFILKFCYKVDVTTVYLGDVKLTHLHEDGDQ